MNKLSEGLRKFVNRVSSARTLDKDTLEKSIKEIQRTLISADVDVKIVQELSNSLRDELKHEKVPKGISKKEYFIKKTYENLTELLGEKNEPKVKPKKILLCGIYGTGKTTTAAKIAKFYLKKGLSSRIICTDTYRPAALEQLRQLTEDIPVCGDENEENAEKILKNCLKEPEKEVTVIDSAGRDSLNEKLLDEIKRLKKASEPDETYLVLSGDIGKTAKKQAQEFQEAIGLTGIIMTKMDSSAKGGGALTACSKAGIPVKFIGTGEKIDDLQAFDPERFVSRLMGFGDLQGILEKVSEQEIEKEDMEDILKGEFNLKKFYKQLEQTSNLGSLKKIVDMMGLGMKLPDDAVEETEENLEDYRVIMDSMTEEELESPKLIKEERINRISKGSGKPKEKVKRLLKQYRTTKKMFDKFGGSKKKMGKLMKKFKKTPL